MYFLSFFRKYLSLKIVFSRSSFYSPVMLYSPQGANYNVRTFIVECIVSRVSAVAFSMALKDSFLP
ncbi:MAG: hypothetical protein H5T91_02805 [Synergistetes bacterium]|nr:hypothetical protein [Synergistota bacterium]